MNAGKVWVVMRWLILWVVLVGPVGLAGCSSESGADGSGRNSLVCGEGTFEDHGQCVAVEAGTGDAGDATMETSDDGGGPADGDTDAYVSHDPADIPESVSVAAGGVTVDFTCTYCDSLGSADVAAFRITKTPITVAQMRRCVEAGACVAPYYEAPRCLEEPRYLIEGADYGSGSEAPNVPVTCVSPRQAMAFCRFAGNGRLPTAEEWLLAARGSVAQTYPWGESDPTCEQHPLAHFSFPDPVYPDDKCCRGDTCDADHFSVGKRPANASVYGVLDILMTEEELVSPSGATDACQSEGGCRMFWQLSRMPGSIEGFFPLWSIDDPPEGPSGGPDPLLGVYSFRCVWEGEE